MKIIWLGNTAPTGNLCDMLAYGDTLYEANYDIEFWLVIPKEGGEHIPPDELFSFGNSSIPEDRVKIIGEDIPQILGLPEDCLTIAKGRQWLEVNPDLAFALRYRPPEENNVLWFSPIKVYSRLRGLIYVPRPANLTLFAKKRKKHRRYDITDCISFSVYKGMDVLNVLAENYNIKVACLANEKQRERFHEEFPNLDVAFNLNKHQLAELFGNSKIFVHPSLLEAASCSLIDAIASGCYPLLKNRASLTYPEQIGPYGNYFGLRDDLMKKVESLLDIGIPHNEIGEWAFKRHHREYNKGTWLDLIERSIALKKSGVSPAILLPPTENEGIMREVVRTARAIKADKGKPIVSGTFVCSKCDAEIATGEQTKNSAGEYFCPECAGIDVDILRNPRKR